MLALLYQPLSPARAVLLAVAAIAAVTVYCLAYTALSGTPESPLDGIRWASVYVVPFLLAFEALKRTTHPLGQALVLAASIAASMALQAVFYRVGALGFEVIGRLPPAGLALLLAWTGPLVAARLTRPSQPAAAGGLPLAPERIDWVAAAGNYVELHAGGRIVLWRAPLAAVEAALAPHGFVRIHRSRLVAERAVAKVRATDVVLHGGRSLATGARYRAALAARFGAA